MKRGDRKNWGFFVAGVMAFVWAFLLTELFLLSESDVSHPAGIHSRAAVTGMGFVGLGLSTVVMGIFAVLLSILSLLYKSTEPLKGLIRGVVTFIPSVPLMVLVFAATDDLSVLGVKARYWSAYLAPAFLLAMSLFERKAPQKTP